MAFAFQNPGNAMMVIFSMFHDLNENGKNNKERMMWE